jgi:hypothetical protein
VGGGDEGPVGVDEDLADDDMGRLVPSLSQVVPLSGEV